MEFRDLRRKDLPTFLPVILQGIGELERALGVAKSAEESVTRQTGSLRNPGFWGLVRLLQVLRIAPIRLLVAVDRGRVVGTATVIFLGNSGYVAGVATDSAVRGRGIATRVMELAHATVRARRKPWLSLDVESGNETAIRLYRRLGYREVARYGWYIGPPPVAPPVQGAPVHEIGSRDKEARAWVSQRLPAAVREALPPNGRRLTHLEFFTRPSKAVVKTWRSVTGHGPQGVVRGFYGPKAQTGYVYALGADPSQPGEALVSLVAPAIAWQRSLGATRIVLAVPQPAEGWSVATSTLGLTRAVSSSLMTRAT